ncbi:MAG: sarcosine oxidase subunit delta [Gemmatimonadetes bacterium]|jgi:sarcosine oxidase subunit delta|nr:sarcosine oxidase subunit delta [Gemmatimonadota bacterium]MDE0964662.1 sarcosine oxidase subunit delta [Candidatus Latescibacterota bacterium]MBT5325221.1 sarcosine oxidase subunit delta [Gemmatimonadota bacterium]MBT5450685.1 sarcosine oxidase subunit delta [Gemmatimonadota bacterium]MBT5802942.1 sarcosine oxidase subunit delta [Gemmatimonadota bacterium]|tara:strand:+ start:1089 stop:1352 length:264 start_codon:yes stop_codon:yes gene_type:complete
MKILHCPINGPRPIQEFSFGGAVRPMPDPQQVDDEAWADYVFNRDGEQGIQREWWYHIASNTWFIAERNITSDQFIRTYLWNGEEAS